jgi:hypothetical protein
VGPKLISLGGVVEHHVEDHLQAAAVQRVDHGLEFAHLPAGVPGAHRGGIGVVGSKKTYRVVTPVVGEAPVEKE